jgi:phosphodiesterase/alkaline phosphatase D-like protein
VSLRRGIVVGVLVWSAAAPIPAGARAPAPPRFFLNTEYTPAGGGSVQVHAGGDLQAALAAAQPGEEVVLDAGATFSGNFVLPKKPPGETIVVRSSQLAGIPDAGHRASPADAADMARIETPNGLGAMNAAPGAHDWRFAGIEFGIAPGVTANTGIVRLGNGDEQALRKLPTRIVVDRCWIHGNATGDARRGVSLNGRREAVVDSYVSDIHEVGADAQAIAGWAGPGPFKIVDDYLEGSGENVMFGGADPAIQGVTPADIEIRGNRLFKPLRWKVGDPSYAGVHWSIKNLFELKNAKRVLIAHNLFENNWGDAQTGFAINLKSANQDGTAPWSATSDVSFRNNVVRHAGSGVGVNGRDPGTQRLTKRIAIRNNLFDDIDGGAWEGSGIFLQVVGQPAPGGGGRHGPAALVVDHNTAINSGNTLVADSPPSRHFAFTNNIVSRGPYGVKGTGTAEGKPTLAAFFPGSRFAGNAIVGAKRPFYPSHNVFPKTLADVGFADLAAHDYHLNADSPLVGHGTGGTDVGANIDAVGPWAPARYRLTRVGRIPRSAGLGGAAVAALLFAAAPAGAASPFINGVTAGEVTQSSAIVWAQTKKAEQLVARVTGPGSSFAAAPLKSKASKDFTVQTKATGLKPATKYTYKFCTKGKHAACSHTGKFQTAPKPSQDKTIKFAFSGDESGQPAVGETDPFWGNFKAFKSMAAEHNNFNMDFGDVIYSDPEVPNIPLAKTVKQKWKKYRQKLGVANQLKIREAAGLYNHWDDHEFRNDFSKAEFGNAIYKAGVEAFRDYEPVTYSSNKGIYRTFRWGKNLEVFFLDMRSFRSAKASAGGTCDNPATPGVPDLAPTAPTTTRSAFSAVVPSLSQAVAPACLAAINNPSSTMLGTSQYNRFVQDVSSSNAQWKVVMTEEPMQQFYALPYDRYEGYAYERVQLLTDLEAAGLGSDLVFLTTDTHAALQNVVRYRTLDGDSAPTNAPAGTPPIDTGFQDFVIGPVATKPFWDEIDDATGSPGNGELVSGAFFKPPVASGGMGMSCAQGGANSYAEVTASAGQLKIEYKDENGGQLLDSDGATPCGPYIYNAP